MADSYPAWRYYPAHDRPPAWVTDLMGAVRAQHEKLNSKKVSGLSSDQALAHLRPGLESLGYRVESGKKRSERIALPVLFGERGTETVRYEVDAVHDDLGVLVEIEAGRGARGNAVYRDLVRTSLIADARFLALGVLAEYRHQSSGRKVVVRSYDDARNLLDALFASQRLRLPFEGLLLFGY